MHIIKKEVMKSSQINFYFTKEDILEIEEYIRERKVLPCKMRQSQKKLRSGC